jgi:hypothetical protein
MMSRSKSAKEPSHILLLATWARMVAHRSFLFDPGRRYSVAVARMSSTAVQKDKLISGFRQRLTTGFVFTRQHISFVRPGAA